MLSRILMVASASILLIAGLLHLHGTFFGSDLSPRDPALKKRMDEVSPTVTDKTTMWRTWVGFNAGFALGLTFIGAVYAFLAVVHSGILFASRFLMALGFLVIAGFCSLSRTYLFNIPFICFCVSLACYVASVVTSWFERSQGPKPVHRLGWPPFLMTPSFRTPLPHARARTP